MRCTSLLLALAACAPTPGPTDSGVDAGPRCVDVPSRLTEFTCVEVGAPGSARCEPTLAEAVTAHYAGCDAGPGIVGYLSLGECATLDSVRWTYGFPGDTYECFYERDGGPSVGGINFSDRGAFVAGHVGDCSTLAPPACRDGG